MTLALAPGITEAQFQATVIDLAERTGWKVAHFHDSRREVVRDGVRRLVGDKQAAGFPDLVLVKARRLIVAELKRDGEDPTEQQNDWLSALSEIHECAPDHVRVTVWRPADWPIVVRTLTSDALVHVGAAA